MPASRFTPNERRVLALTGVGHFAAHFYELMYPTLAVALVLETGQPLDRVLGWSFAGYLLFGLGALPAGLLTDRIGGRRVLLGGLLGMGIAALGAGWATPGPGLALLLAVIGVCASAYHPAGMSLISHTVAARGRGLGLNGIAGNLGIALTPILTALLCGRIGWQHTYLVVGAVTCVLAIALDRLPIDEQPVVVTAEPAPIGGSSPRVLFALLCITSALGGVSYRVNTVAQPAHFAAEITLLGYGAMTSVVYVAGIGGQYLGGVLADRHDLRWLYLLFHALSLPALLLMSMTHEAALAGVAIAFVFFSLGMQPIENSLFASYTPARWRATAYGIKFVMTFGVGSFAVGLVQLAERGGRLAAVFGWAAGFVGALVVVIAALIWLSAGRPVRGAPPVGELVA